MEISLVVAVIFIVLLFFWSKTTEKKLFHKLKSFSFDLMEKNNSSFLNLAKSYFEKYESKAEINIQKKCQDIESLINPISKSLEKLNEYNKEIEKQRIEKFSSLNKQIENLISSERLLRKEASNLSRALKSPNIRGSWGQVHLRRVVELSGMLKNCDFFEQHTKVVDGKKFVPDMLVKLPGQRQIIVDAKTPIDAYLQAMEEECHDKRKDGLKTHAKHLKSHMKILGSKEYWKYFSPSPEYVVLFLPAEAFFSAALQEDSHLLEEAAKKNVIIATPTTLIAILKAIAYAWKHENISKNTQKIACIGKELYEGLKIASTNWEKVGKNLTNSLDSYKKASNSLEKKVLKNATLLKDFETNIFQEK